MGTSRWHRIGLAHTTMAGIHRIERLPGITQEDFQKTIDDALSEAVPLPDLNRVTNIVGQAVLREEGEASAPGGYLWALFFNGVHAPDRVREHCEAMYANVRERVESVGRRTSFTMATLEGRWEVAV
jgi:hypothetical protein